MRKGVLLECSFSNSWAATTVMQTATLCKLDLVWPHWAFRTHPESPQPPQVPPCLTCAIVLLCATSLHRLPQTTQQLQ